MSSSETTHAGVWRSNRPVVIFIGGFILFNALFFFLSVYKPFIHTVIIPFTAFIASFCSKGLNLLGLKTHAVGDQLSGGALSLSLRNGCNGVLAMNIYFSAVLAFPSPLWHKLKGLVLGFVVIFLVNAIRVMSLYLIGLHWPRIFEDVHIFVWQALIILIVTVVWMRWARFEAKPSPR